MGLSEADVRLIKGVRLIWGPLNTGFTVATNISRFPSIKGKFVYCKNDSKYRDVAPLTTPVPEGGIHCERPVKNIRVSY